MEPFAPRRRSKLASEMNVVPYIDVMLVLLVIFMITAPLMQTGIEVSLPAGEGVIENAENEPVTLSIDQKGQIYLSVADDPASPLSVERASELIEKMLALNPELKVNIAGDKGVVYGEVAASFQWLRDVGVTQVGLITTPPEQ